jgi:magnesium-protoporphyrin O-methyltransferase
MDMRTTGYAARRGEIETYFDRTAVKAWEHLTSDAPVGRIRATVRAGRDRMRATLLSWLPADMHGMRLLDAGCGTGALAVEAARRGAHVVAIDLSPTLVELAVRRVAQHLETFDNGGHIDFRSGDMLDAGLGPFDHVVAMDSLIHSASRWWRVVPLRTHFDRSFSFAPHAAAGHDDASAGFPARIVPLDQPVVEDAPARGDPLRRLAAPRERVPAASTPASLRVPPPSRSTVRRRAERICPRCLSPMRRRRTCRCRACCDCRCSRPPSAWRWCCWSARSTA